MEEFIVYVEENIEVALSVFEKYYNDRAIEEGELMLCDPSLCDGSLDDDRLDEVEPDELYELYAHNTGHSATYSGSIGVIKELGVDFKVDYDDEDLQWEILLILEKEPK